jgi:hypothetical protein
MTTDRPDCGRQHSPDGLRIRPPSPGPRDGIYLVPTCRCAFPPMSKSVLRNDYRTQVGHRCPCADGAGYHLEFVSLRRFGSSPVFPGSSMKPEGTFRMGTWSIRGRPSISRPHRNERMCAGAAQSRSASRSASISRSASRSRSAASREPQPPGCSLTRPAESAIAIVNFYRSNGAVRVGAPAFPR